METDGLPTPDAFIFGEIQVLMNSKVQRKNAVVFPCIIRAFVPQQRDHGASRAAYDAMVIY